MESPLDTSGPWDGKENLICKKRMDEQIPASMDKHLDVLKLNEGKYSLMLILQVFL